MLAPTTLLLHVHDDVIKLLRIDNECLRQDNMHLREDIKYLSDSMMTVKGDIKTMLRIIVGAGLGWVGSGEERRASAVAVAVAKEEEEELVVWPRPPAAVDNGSSKDAVAFKVAADIDGDGDGGQVVENSNKSTTMMTTMTKKSRTKKKTKTGQTTMKMKKKKGSDKVASASIKFEYWGAAAAAAASSARARIMAVGAFTLMVLFVSVITCVQDIRGGNKEAEGSSNVRVGFGPSSPWDQKDERSQVASSAAITVKKRIEEPVHDTPSNNGGDKLLPPPREYILINDKAKKEKSVGMNLLSRYLQEDNLTESTNPMVLTTNIPTY